MSAHFGELHQIQSTLVEDTFQLINRRVNLYDVNPLDFTWAFYLTHCEDIGIPFWLFTQSQRQEQNIVDIETVSYPLDITNYPQLKFTSNALYPNTEIYDDILVADFAGPNGSLSIEKDIYKGSPTIAPFIVERVVVRCGDDNEDAIVYYTVIRRENESDPNSQLIAFTYGISVATSEVGHFQVWSRKRKLPLSIEEISNIRIPLEQYLDSLVTHG